jgi:hypothetical protein
VPVRRSVRHDYVVCLDCGHRGKMLLRHISTQHGLSRHEYLKRWGLRSDHPLTAPGYSEQRSTMVKQLGLRRRAMAAKPAAAPPTTPASANADLKSAAKPARRRGIRSAAKSDSVTAAAKTSPRQSRSRSRSSRATV